jgi:hypothetical protein
MKVATLFGGLATVFTLIAGSSWAQCPDTNSSSSQPWDLTGQPNLRDNPLLNKIIKVQFQPVASVAQERLVLFKDDQWYTKILPNEPPKYIKWPGGSIGYTFEICSPNKTWIYKNPWYPEVSDVPGGASFILRPADGQTAALSSSVTLAWGDSITEPPPAQAPGSVAGGGGRPQCHPHCSWIQVPCPNPVLAPGQPGAPHFCPSYQCGIC